MVKDQELVVEWDEDGGVVVDADAGEGAYDPPNRYSPTATCAERGGVNVRTTSGTQCIRAEVLPSPNETP